MERQFLEGASGKRASQSPGQLLYDSEDEEKNPTYQLLVV